MYSLTPVAIYLSVVLGLAVISIVASLGVVAEAVVRNRRTHVVQRESMGDHDGRLALHH